MAVAMTTRSNGSRWIKGRSAAAQRRCACRGPLVHGERLGRIVISSQRGPQFGVRGNQVAAELRRPHRHKPNPWLAMAASDHLLALQCDSHQFRKPAFGFVHVHSNHV